MKDNDHLNLLSIGGQVVTQKDVERFVTHTGNRDINHLRSLAGRNGTSKRATKTFIHAMKDAFRS